MIRFRQALLGLALTATAAGAASGHEIPNQVTARLIAKPSGQSLQLLVRAPLSSMRDVELPALDSGYLDIDGLKPRLPEMADTWIAGFVEIYENGELLPKPRVAATQISIPSDRSFAAFDQALAHVREPLPANGENLVSEQVLFDVLLEYPIQSELAEFSIRPRLEHLALRVMTAVQFYSPEGVVRGYQLLGDQGRVPLDPSWSQAAGRFLESGFLHILEGPDHLLFLLCLVIPFRRMRPLVWIVTAFTAAHSATLIASAAGLAPGGLWFPPLIETLIAATILYMALENIVGPAGTRRRWMFAFGFGLIHGFGFSFALRETLQFAGAHLVTSLLAFNIGVEIGQLAALLVMVPALDLLFRFVVEERVGTIIVSAFVAHTSWHWLTDRAEALSRYSFDWAGLAAIVLRLAAMLAAAGAVWAAFRLLRRRFARNGPVEAGAPEH